MVYVTEQTRVQGGRTQEDQARSAKLPTRAALSLPTPLQVSGMKRAAQQIVHYSVIDEVYLDKNITSTTAWCRMLLFIVPWSKGRRITVLDQSVLHRLLQKKKVPWGNLPNSLYQARPTQEVLYQKPTGLL